MVSLLVPLLAHALSINVGASNEARVRSMQSSIRFDDVVTASSELELRSLRTSWRLSYSPSLTYYSLGDSSESRTLLHSGGLGARLQLSRRTMVYFAESASYGTRNFRLIGIDASNYTTPPSNDTTPPSTDVAGRPTPSVTQENRNIRFSSVATTATLMHQFTRRTSGSIAAGYSINGGMGSFAQRYYPRFNQLQGTGQINYALSLRDTATIRMEELWVTTSIGSSANLVTVEGEYAHVFNEHVSAMVGAGPAFWDWRSGDGEERFGLLPAASALVRFNDAWRGRELRLDVSERLSPRMDRILGTVNPMSTSTVAIESTIDKLRLRASGYVMIVGDTMESSTSTVIGSSQSAAYAITRYVSVETGARQSLVGGVGGADSTFLWTVYATAAVSSGAISL